MIKCLSQVNYLAKPLMASNQMFRYTRCNTPKRVTSWRGPSSRHCSRATQLLSKKCRSGGEPLATKLNIGQKMLRFREVTLESRKN